MEDSSYEVRDESAPSGGFWSEVVKFALIAVLIVLPIRLFIAQPFIVSGASMDPTFGNGEYLIVDQLSYKFEPPHRGDVIIFKWPEDESKFFIKRVIGLPEEIVEINEGKVTIKNTLHPEGLILDETYIDPSNIRTDDAVITLGKGEYFVMGDNRNGSSDSRSWGPVKKNLIIGRPFVRLLPVNKFEVFPGDFVIEE
jgi:signal peptidase I